MDHVCCCAVLLYRRGHLPEGPWRLLHSSPALQRGGEPTALHETTGTAGYSGLHSTAYHGMVSLMALLAHSSKEPTGCGCCAVGPFVSIVACCTVQCCSVTCHVARAPVPPCPVHASKMDDSPSCGPLHNPAAVPNRARLAHYRFWHFVCLPLLCLALWLLMPAGGELSVAAAEPCRSIQQRTWLTTAQG